MKSSNRKFPLIIDCDTGEDDAIAIVLAVKAGLPLKYVVTGHGNTTLDNATENSSRILSILEASNVTVIKGEMKPMKPHKLEKEGFTAGEDFIGQNGICNVELPKSRYDNVRDYGQDEYIKKLAEAIKKEGKVDYIITGPCTNFAKLCKYMGKDIKKYINLLYIMGGAIYVKGTRGPGVKNTSHEEGIGVPETWAEFNFYCDPYAIQTVLEYDFNPVVVSWDTCIGFELPIDYIRKMISFTPGGKFIVQLMRAFMDLYGIKNKTKFELCDPLTIMAYMGYGKVRKDKINIVTTKKHFGKSFHDDNGYDIRYFYSSSKQEVEKIINSMMKYLEIERIDDQKVFAQTAKQANICVIGSVNMDLVMQMNKLPVRGQTVVGNTIQHIPGGKGANQAVAASRLGAKVSFIGRVGSDNFGIELFNFLKSENLELNGIRKSKTNSGLAMVAVDSKGQNSITIFPGSNADVSEEYIAERMQLLKQADVIVAQYEIPLHTVEYILMKAREMNKITILNPAPAKPTSNKIFSHVDYLIINQTELAYFMNTNKMMENIDEVIVYAKKLREKGPKVIIVTLGDKGVVAVTDKQVVRLDRIRVDVVDTTAAGDCFVGAFATQIGKGVSLEDSLAFANRAAALSVQKLGASVSLPYLAEVVDMQQGGFLEQILTK